MATPTKAGDKSVKPKTAAATKKPSSPAKPAIKTKAKPAAAPKAKPAAAPKAAKSVTPVKAAKPAARAAKTTGNKRAKGAVPPEQHRYYVEVAAYYIAERRGFQEGNALDDWAAAEAEVERLLSAGVLNP